MKKLSIKSAINEAFSQMVGQLASSFFVLVAIVCMSILGLIVAAFGGLGIYILYTATTGIFLKIILWTLVTLSGILTVFFIYLLSAYIPYAYTTIFIHSFDKKPLSEGKLIIRPQNSSQYWKVFVATILYSLLVFVGFACLIIPGIIFAVRFRFYPQYIIAENKRILESLNASWSMSSGNFFNIFVLVVLYRVAQTLTAGLAGIPLFLFGYPFSYATDVYIYRTLRKKQ